MESKVIASDSFAALQVKLDYGEVIRAEPGAMAAQRRVEMTTGMSGSAPGLPTGTLGRIIARLLGRLLSGESFFMNTFIARYPNAEVLLAPAVPGEIIEERLPRNSEIFIHSGGFLACTDTVHIDGSFEGLKGLLSREGFFFVRASTGDLPGTVFFNTYGAAIEMRVRAGKGEQSKELQIDNGHLVAYSQGVDYSIKRVRGLKPLLLGGEGLVLTFSGKGKVWVQTRELPSLAAVLRPHMPK